MSNKPIMHGRDHRHGGADPIPGLAALQTPFAYIRSQGTINITADNVLHYQSLQDGVSANFETSNSDVFSNASTTAINGSTLYGVKMSANGTYRIEWNFQWNSGTAGVRAEGYHTTSGGNTISFWQGGRTAGLILDGWDQGSGFSGNLHTTFDEFVDANDTNPAPIYVVPYCRVASGTNPTVRIEGFITYLGEYSGTAL